MRIETTNLAEVLVLAPQPFHDERGLFNRTFDATIFDDYLTTVSARDAGAGNYETLLKHLP